jgi:hypothetical protein
LVKSTVALVQEVLLSNAPSQSQPLADQCSDLLQQASQASKGQLSIVIMLVVLLHSRDDLVSILPSVM